MEPAMVLKLEDKTTDMDTLKKDKFKIWKFRKI